jgi:hypothetical protein
LPPGRILAEHDDDVRAVVHGGYVLEPQEFVKYCAKGIAPFGRIAGRMKND